MDRILKRLFAALALAAVTATMFAGAALALVVLAGTAFAGEPAQTGRQVSERRCRTCRGASPAAPTLGPGALMPGLAIRPSWKACSTPWNRCDECRADR